MLTNVPNIRFPIGFTKRAREKHQELMEYIVEELGEFMAPDWLGRGVTLNDLWHLNKTLIVRGGEASLVVFILDKWVDHVGTSVTKCR
jgi:hypothetical protein